MNDARIAPAIAYNDFINEPVALKRVTSKGLNIPRLPVDDRVNGRIWQEPDDIAVSTIFSAPTKMKGYGLELSNQLSDKAILAAAHSRTFHPVRARLDACFERHGHERGRVERLFMDYCGVPDHPYYREAALAWCIAAVARIYEPGTKFDNVPIFGGRQGSRKSTFIRVLSMGWFKELGKDFDNLPRMVESQKGGWLIEIPELSGFYKSIVELVKQFFSTTEDQVRLAWGRRVGVYPRQCVFAGTTNRGEYLRDPTGNRRFWPIDVLVPKIDTDRLLRECPLIWGEAVALYRETRAVQPRGALHIDLKSPEAIERALMLQEGRQIETAESTLADEIKDWLDTPCTEYYAADPARSSSGFEVVDADDAVLGLRNTVTAKDVICGLLRHDEKAIADARVLKPVTDALAMLPGWERPNNGSGKLKRHGKVVRAYRRAGSEGIWSPLETTVGRDNDDDLL